MTILLSTTENISFGFPLISANLSASISAIIVPLSVAVAVTSNVVPSLGAISDIFVQVFVHAVHIKFTSLQSNVLVFMASENVTKNFTVVADVGSSCPLAKSIDTCGLVASKVQAIVAYLIVSLHHRLAESETTDKKSLLNIHKLEHQYCILL
jgi:hypothetical protein